MIEEGIIGILGSVLGALSSWLAIRRTIRAPLESLQAKVEHLEREKLHGLATAISQHIGDDKSQRMLTLLEGIQANMSIMAGKIDRLCEVTAKHGAQIEANERYIQNLDAALQRRQE